MVATVTNPTTDENVEALPGPTENESPENECGEPETANITEADQLGEIADVAVQCRMAAEELDTAKAVVKDRKAEYEGCVLKLRRLAEAIRNDEDRPLFSGLKDGQEENAEGGSDEVCLGAEIAVLDLRPHIKAKLNGAKVWTVNDLQGLFMDISLDLVEWPKGIGPAAVTEIENAVIEYVAKNRTGLTD